MKKLPNILTASRLVLTLFMFVALATAVGALPYISERLTPEQQFSLQRWAVIAFFVSAITDFFDGWLARKLHAESVWGAILDPIADKVLVCGAVLGLMSLGPQPAAALPAGLILFREFAVSALRETMAGRIELPVTLAAKWKTTVQMVALAALQLTLLWSAFGLQNEDGSPLSWQPAFESFAVFLIWFAAVITLWTGWQYFREARRQMQDL